MRKLIVLFLIISVLFISTMALAENSNNDTKDWKLVTSLGVLMEKAGADADITKSLVLTVEYDKFLNESALLYMGSDVVFSFAEHDTVFKPFVGVEYTISDVTMVEARIDYNTKDKSATLLVRMIWTW